MIAHEPFRVEDDGGQLIGPRVVRPRPVTPDADGRRRSDDIPGSEHVIPTTRAGVFAGGGIVNGGLTEVQAAAEGTRASKEIDELLSPPAMVSIA